MEIAQLPSQKRKNLIIIAILVIGLPLLSFAAYQVVQLLTGAGGSNKPKNVVISNLTTSAITISWTTDTQSTGSVIPIENGNSKSPVIDKRGNSRRYTHYVELTSLEPNTKYNFQIVSDSTKYSAEGGKDFSFKTAPITADTPTPNPIYGTVSGGSSDDVILYALPKDKSAYPVSATIPSGGNWIMDLSALRGIDDKKMVSTSNSSNLVVIAVGGSGKGASVEGIYSDIFDSNGKLKDTNPLTLSAKTDMYKAIPSEALLTAYATSNNTTPTPTPSKPTPTPTQPEEEEEEEEVIFNRRFRLVQQLQWIDMVGGTGASVTGKTGAESIQVANLTDTGFSVIWVSKEKEQGTVKYGTSKTSLSNTASDQRDGLTTKGSYYVHLVDITRIQPETTYYYEVVSGSNTYDNNGAKYTLKTFATLNSPPPFESITGQISNLPEHGEVVVLAYIQDVDSSGSSGDSTKMATLIDDNGKWILSIGDSRIQNGSAYYEYTSGDSMKINLVTTFDTSLTTERMEGITERDVDIALAESSGSSSSTSVSALDNYGILGASNGTSLPVNSTPTTNNYVVDGTGQTPQTGILDNMLYLLVFSGGLIGASYIIYRLGKQKPRSKSKMSKHL